MQHFWSLENVQFQNVWLTIGSFDGVHRGHQEVVTRLTAGAHEEGVPAVVLTFYPHPSKVLRRRNDRFYLTTPEERANLLGELGVDAVITYQFDMNIAAMSARDFMEQLHRSLNIQKLWIGYDFALGRRREGDVTLLRHLGEEFGYIVHEISPVKMQGEVVSSSQIRALLSKGEVEKASQLLGRPYRVQGIVETGDSRGYELGIPTANLHIWEELALPKAGVYVSQAEVNGRLWGAVTNVGVRPTFEHVLVPPRVETHILDFSSDIYGESVEVTFITRLRDERQFPTIKTLVTQIQQDIFEAREILSS